MNHEKELMINLLGLLYKAGKFKNPFDSIRKEKNLILTFT
jgi:hypothetical protein